MSSPTLAASPERAYDPFAPELHDDPYPAELYRWLRDEQPVHRSEARGFWALSRFADVQAASRDWRTFSSARGVDLDASGEVLYGQGNIIELDPPRHDELRDVVRGVFAPRLVAQLEAIVRAEAEALFAPLRRSRGGDLGMDLCWPLALNVVATLLGVPRAERPSLERLFYRALVRTAGVRELPPDAVVAAVELRDRLSGLAHGTRSGGGGGLLATIAAAHGGGRVAEGEVPGLAILLFAAGIDSPAAFATNALLLLARHSRQRELLTAGAVSTAAAVEELLRFEPPVQNLARTTTAPVRLHDVAIPAGATVLLVYGAANRDERRWEDPDTLDFARAPQRNLGFGEGIHFCLGAALARLEARIAIELVLAEAPRYAVAGRVERLVKQNDWGVLRLPAAW